MLQQSLMIFYEIWQYQILFLVLRILTVYLISREPLLGLDVLDLIFNFLDFGLNLILVLLSFLV